MDSEDKSNTKKWETWHRTLKRGDSSIDKKARRWLCGPRIENTICGLVSRCPAKGPPHIRANSMKLIKPIRQGDKKAQADEHKALTTLLALSSSSFFPFWRMKFFFFSLALARFFEINLGPIRVLVTVWILFLRNILYIYIYNLRCSG